jgi:hypothetical protein
VFVWYATSTAQLVDQALERDTQSADNASEAAHENAQRHRQLSCHGSAYPVKHPLNEVQHDKKSCRCLCVLCAASPINSNVLKTELVTSNMDYDYIIIGSGFEVLCVISEKADTKFLVIEKTFAVMTLKTNRNFKKMVMMPYMIFLESRKLSVLNTLLSSLVLEWAQVVSVCKHLTAYPKQPFQN